MRKKLATFIKSQILNNNKGRSKYFYPLLNNAFSESDLLAGIKVIISGQLTMSKITKRFEKEFAKKIGAKDACPKIIMATEYAAM